MPTPSSKNATAIESLDPSGNGLRAEFQWKEDRFEHQLFAVTATEIIPLLISVEGDSSDFWPCSPPLKEFSESYIQSDENQGTVRLLIGAAGSTHWAASVDVAGENAKDKPTLIFDIACRLKTEPKWLGSTYKLQVAQDVMLSLLKADIRTSNGIYRVQATMPREHAGLNETQVHVSGESGNISIYPELHTELTLPATVRWRYEVSRLG